jgi:hypothetical protein
VKPLFYFDVKRVALSYSIQFSWRLQQIDIEFALPASDEVIMNTISR